MKNIFICLCFLLYISLEAQAQINENMNYITTRVTDKNNTESGLTDIVYYDGLGREKESIRLGISPNGDDLYTHIVYDGLGNKVLESIPTPSSKNGAFCTVRLYGQQRQRLHQERIYESIESTDKADGTGCRMVFEQCRHQLRVFGKLQISGSRLCDILYRKIRKKRSLSCKLPEM